MGRVAAVQHALLAWYAAHGRDLPWRRTHDPYHILVAEVMLQQTQVDRVLPKYREFLETYPTVASLAAAPRADVLRLWSGLGYNLRAVRLHQTAQDVVERHGGRFPETVAVLLNLRGVGPYTAGAIACFAYRQQVTFMDTNVRRVLGRVLLGVLAPTPADDRLVLPAAEAVLPADAYAWHQALMDLGATVCVSRKPRCAACPLLTHCAAQAVLAQPLMHVAEPRATYRTKEAPFRGSRRYYRGRIVEALRSLPPAVGMAIPALQAHLTALGAGLTAPKLDTIIAGLVKDGLVVVETTDGGVTPVIHLP